jgi:hypothetical protein
MLRFFKAFLGGKASIFEEHLFIHQRIAIQTKAQGLPFLSKNIGASVCLETVFFLDYKFALQTIFYEELRFASNGFHL